MDPSSLAATKRVLLVDDVCTEGSTLRECGTAISQAYPDVEVVAATAGQMTVKQVVLNPEKLWTPVAG